MCQGKDEQIREELCQRFRIATLVACQIRPWVDVDDYVDVDVAKAEIQQANHPLNWFDVDEGISHNLPRTRRRMHLGRYRNRPNIEQKMLGNPRTTKQTSKQDKAQGKTGAEVHFESRLRGRGCLLTRGGLMGREGCPRRGEGRRESRTGMERGKSIGVSGWGWEGDLYGRGGRCGNDGRAARRDRCVCV